MSVDQATVRRIARLARLSLSEADVAPLQGELNAILKFVEALESVDVDGIEPMTSVMPMKLRLRADVVNDGENVAGVTKNAPQSEDGFFLVPKVVE
ncbi:MAG: Asp-tRNA(Asn)/Glu-tRNA(Gln) amidotransferase subunit GatC [Hyphomicrobiales bacterium]|nr:Asp-tRNA(Asn)/Glu-tRNA(Gln) amidotransferase subunit GatC [Hyphomicrobiales bacterium]